MRQAQRPWEVEAALLVMARDPVSALRRLRGIRSLGSYRLVPHPLVVIEDKYWDTPEHVLGRRHVALRVRQYNGRPWATLKGPGRRRVGKRTEQRLEIEVPWRAAIVRKKLAPALARLGVPDVSPLEHGPWPPFQGAMARMGLSLIQSRTTRRWPRTVLLTRSKSKEPLAEMAIDVVTYRMGSVSPRFPEVEVEVKDRSRGDHVERFISLLLSKSKVKLVPWRYPKLAIGRALELLASEGHVESSLGSGGWLTEESFREIRQVLSRRLVKEKTPA